MMEAVSASGTSVNFYDTTWKNIPEGRHLYVQYNVNNNPRVAPALSQVNPVHLLTHCLFKDTE
jgi:hypothetical protein